MQIVFVHPNYPAQFGHIAGRLARAGHDCVFVTRVDATPAEGVRLVRYDVTGGATRQTHYCGRTFENCVWQAHAVYDACKGAKLAPDLVVGHSGFGSTVFLPELWSAPIVNCFEYFYHPHGSDMDYRPEFPPAEIDFLRSRARNAMILLDLHACAAGYAPTEWQRSLLPEVWRSKVDVIHDGIDTTLWRRRPGPRRIGDETIPDDVRIVTYVARGLEAMRGFDVCVVLASDVAPVREVIHPGRTGLVAGFFDVDALADTALRVLEDPAAHRPLGREGRAMVTDRYSLDVTHPRLTDLLLRTAAQRR